MPGKNNPVMPETVNNMYYWVSGNNLAIEHAAHGAQLDLAVMIPNNCRQINPEHKNCRPSPGAIRQALRKVY